MRELLARALEPNWPDQDPQHRRYLALDLRRARELDEGDIIRLGQWLQRQPVPVLGVSSASPLSEAVDVQVDDEASLERIARKIEDHPNASAVLVQTLRAVGQLSTTQALTLESLAYATLQGGGEFSRWLADYRAGHPTKGSKAQPIQPVLMQRAADRLKIVLNSPENRNALSCYLRDALAEAFKLVAMDPSIVHVEVSGNGPCFSAGGDLNEFGSVADLAEAHRIRLLRMPAQYLAACADRYTIRVHGACIGAGIEMPAFAKQIVAASDTIFQLPEVNMGLIPGAGGCVSIPRRIGRQRTAYLAISGEPIGAQLALQWGLIDAVVD